MSNPPQLEPHRGPHHDCDADPALHHGRHRRARAAVRNVTRRQCGMHGAAYRDSAAEVNGTKRFYRRPVSMPRSRNNSPAADASASTARYRPPAPTLDRTGRDRHRHLHVHARRQHRERRAAHLGDRTARGLRDRAVDRARLPAGGVLARDGCGAHGRPVRQEAHLSVRPGPVHRGVAGLRAVTGRALADRHARGARAGRRIRSRAGRGDHRGDLSAQGARPGARLHRYQRAARCRPGTDLGRPDPALRELALDVPGQHPDRHRGDRRAESSPSSYRPVTRPRRVRLARYRAACRRAGEPGARLDLRAATGVRDQPGARAVRAGDGRDRLVPGLATASRLAADRPAPVFQQPARRRAWPPAR